MAVSVLATDGYKFSMAEAGWPLRRETFYYSHRKGGPQALPFDVAAEIEALLPSVADADWAFLGRHGYDMGAAFKAAMASREVAVRALPKGTVFFAREPVFSVTGPSALVSWLEPLLLQLSYRIQVASLALTAPEQLPKAVGTVTCEAQRELVLRTLDAVQVAAPEVRVDADGYRERVRARVLELVEIVGQPERLFEVGLRAATCLPQHLLALEACRSAGLSRTSNVSGAQQLGLAAVGTMGHEHVQRFGSDDAAFRAMVERRPQRSSFLLDTFDTMRSGIPAAFAVMAERPNEGDSIRYDSGDKEAQYRFAEGEARRQGLQPVHILEDGFDAEQTRRFEALRIQLQVPPSRQVYGYGGYLVAGTAGSFLTRDRVSAVYKLSQTGARPTMKFANEAGLGKQSVPGQPVVFRRVSGAGPIGIIGQEGESAPPGYVLLTGAERVGPSLAELGGAAAEQAVISSPRTQALVDGLTAERAARSGV